jgi:hypothetical protein
MCPVAVLLVGADATLPLMRVLGGAGAGNRVTAGLAGGVGVGLGGGALRVRAGDGLGVAPPGHVSGVLACVSASGPHLATGTIGGAYQGSATWWPRTSSRQPMPDPVSG